MKELTVLWHRGEPDENGFRATCLEVPGANGQGKTREECLANLNEAIKLLLGTQPKGTFRLEQLEIGPASKLKIDDLIESLKSHNIPVTVGTKKEGRMLLIGPEAEYALLIKTNPKGKIKTAFVIIRYENPLIKNVIDDWLDACGLIAAEPFYKWAARIAPSTSKLIQRRWKLNLSNLSLSSVHFEKYVLVFQSGTDLSAIIDAQLMRIPHKRMGENEFIRCDEYIVSGELENEIYFWSEDKTNYYITVYSAPAVTMLSLWAVPPDAPVEIGIKNCHSKK